MGVKKEDFRNNVFKSFASIVTKVKKFAKPEKKQSLEEWEVKLSEHSATGLENERETKSMSSKTGCQMGCSEEKDGSV
eukprot:scaffold115417_cov33-Attheya_sp.AAC.2